MRRRTFSIMFSLKVLTNSHFRGSTPPRGTEYLKEMTLDEKIEYSINLLRKSEEMALRMDPENGFYLAFSGGKDSQVLYHLAVQGGVKFKAHMNLTSVDPPEVIRFVKKNYPDVELIKPRMSIYEMAKKKGCLPTRLVRWCCEEFKEMSGAGKVTLIGIRKSESTNRKKRNEIETGDRKFSGTFDQWSEHQEKMVTCVGGKDKILVSPILYWTEKDVWDYLKRMHIPYCELYDKGYKRIGCIMCPMSNYKQNMREMKDFPHVGKNWRKTIEWLIENKWKDKPLLQDPDMALKWWISKKSFKEFYADEVMQQKLEFKD